MIDRKDIETVVSTIAREFHPIRIWLFGSYADGSPHEASDVDLLVVMQTDIHPARQAAMIRLRVRPGFPLDLIVRTPEQIHDRLHLGDSFLSGIFSTGKLLYEA